MAADRGVGRNVQVEVDQRVQDQGGQARREAHAQDALPAGQSVDDAAQQRGEQQGEEGQSGDAALDQRLKQVVVGVLVAQADLRRAEQRVGRDERAPAGPQQRERGGHAERILPDPGSPPGRGEVGARL